MPDKKVCIHYLDKEYMVPDSLTVIMALEYSGHKLKMGHGCGSGACGACSVIYRLDSDPAIKCSLACQKIVEDGMYILQFPYHTPDKRVYDLESSGLDKDIITTVFPEIHSCISCNACTNACPVGIDVLKYVNFARQGDYKSCAETSFSCISCNLCFSRCPMNIRQFEIAMLSRRLNGRSYMGKSPKLEKRIKEVDDGLFDNAIEDFFNMEINEMKIFYENRDFEKQERSSCIRIK